MNYNQTLQTVLDYVDENITDELTAALLAEKAGYSPLLWFYRFTTPTTMGAATVYNSHLLERVK